MEKGLCFIYIEPSYRKMFPSDKTKFSVIFDNQKTHAWVDKQNKMWLNRQKAKIGFQQNDSTIEITKNDDGTYKILKIE